jgi:hypothetical protein
MRINLSKLRVGDVVGVTALLHPFSIITRLVTHGHASHVAQVIGDGHSGTQLAEMAPTETERRYFDPQANKLLTVAEWEALPSSMAMEACTQVDIRSGLELVNLGKYQPNHNPFHSYSVWVRRHHIYDLPAKRDALNQRTLRMYVSGVKYDYSELMSFLRLGENEVGKYICSELPLRNLIADGGFVPREYEIQCSPATYEKWDSWKDVSLEVADAF